MKVNLRSHGASSPHHFEGSQMQAPWFLEQTGVEKGVLMRNFHLQPSACQQTSGVCSWLASKCLRLLVGGLSLGKVWEVKGSKWHREKEFPGRRRQWLFINKFSADKVGTWPIVVGRHLVIQILKEGIRWLNVMFPIISPYCVDVMSFIAVCYVYYFNYLPFFYCVCLFLHLFVHLSKAFDFNIYLLLTACIDVYFFHSNWKFLPLVCPSWWHGIGVQHPDSWH